MIYRGVSFHPGQSHSALTQIHAARPETKKQQQQQQPECHLFVLFNVKTPSAVEQTAAAASTAAALTPLAASMGSQWLPAARLCCLFRSSGQGSLWDVKTSVVRQTIIITICTFLCRQLGHKASPV